MGTAQPSARRIPAGRGVCARRRGAAAGELARVLAREPELITALVGPSGGFGGPAPAAIREAVFDAASICPDYADVQYFCARALMQIDENASAEALLERALSLNPDYVDALILRGRLACRLGQDRVGISLLTRAVALGADFADVHKLLGDLRRRLGDSESARACYERALRINARFTAARIALSELME